MEVFVRRNHEINFAQWFSMQLVRVEVEPPGRLGLEVRVAREDP